VMSVPAKVVAGVAGGGSAASCPTT
jgi:hypothetical protein